MESTANQQANIQDVLQLLKELDTSTGFNIYIPSLKRSIKFKQLNTQQLKRLLKTVIDSPIHNTEFTLTFNTLIKENCLESIDTETLTCYDKIFILFKTRIESVSPEYTFTYTEDEINEYNLTDKTLIVNLADRYNSVVEQTPVFEIEDVNIENINLTIGLPSLKTENKLEKELYKNVNLEINTPEQLRTTLGDTFINELTKFIVSLKIQEKEINFDNLDFKTRIKLVEQLPTSVINKVLKYIEKYKKQTNELLAFNIPGTPESKEMPLDATFFNI